MKILLLGKNGQIGWELQRTLAPLGEVIAIGHKELDLTDERAIRRAVRSTNPNLIINAAAYTAVDKAESEPELAMAINGTAPGILAEEAALLRAALIHYSTDYVFDGTKTTPYTEGDTPNPINTYGITKLAGEEAIIATEANHLIFRTSWAYGLRGSNFLRTILRLAAEKDELSIVNDQIGAPTWSRMIAEATALAIIFDRTGKTLQGMYNLTAAGQTSWYGFAEAILTFTMPAGGTTPKLKAISTAEYKAAAARPKYSGLNCSALEEAAALKLPHWRSSLKMASEEQRKET